MLEDPDTDVVIQAMLTVKLLQIPSLGNNIKSTMAAHKAKGVQLVGEQILNPPEIRGFGISSGPELNEAQQAMIEQGAVIFNELCAQCHGADGTGTPVGEGLVMAPPLNGSLRIQSHPDYVIKTLLHGLSGPIEGKTYPGNIMVGMQEQSDEWIAAIASFIRLNLTNEASLVTAEDVARVRKEAVGQQGPYQYQELMSSVPHAMLPQDGWKVTASHTASIRIGGTASPMSAFNFEGWTTGEKQEEGMWFQLELPEPTTLTEIHFNSPPLRRGYGPQAPPPIQTYPRGYEVQVSMDGKNWNKTVASGQCNQSDNVISFDPVQTRYLRITQTSSLGEEEENIPWSMRQLKIFGLVEQKEAVN